jgi:4-amino-4-deoxy-L-arabinose transferase-like glycosyltransferase
VNNSATRDAFFAIFAVIAALCPFLNKAFHIDDPLFLWIAQQVSQHPGDPYGFSLNWFGFAQPMFSIMQNPPLSSYYMALAATFLGWSEPAMHGAFLVPAVAATLGTFFLARRLCDSPLLAALLTLFTPVFLVSATGVMCDVWLLALWVWSVESWLRGLERHSYRFLFLASVLAAAAAMTKYFGASLVPLLAAYTLVRDRRFTYRLLFLLIPVTVIIMYEVMTKAKYGEGLFSNAMIYPLKHRRSEEKHLFAQFIIGLSFTGGCLFPAVFYMPFLKSRRVLISGLAIFVALLLLLYFGFGRGLATGPIATTAPEALFATIGVGILALAVTDVAQRRTADSVLLSLWVIGTFFFAAIMNWSITARTLLPMAPAVMILLLRRFNTSQEDELKQLQRQQALQRSLLPEGADQGEALKRLGVEGLREFEEPAKRIKQLQQELGNIARPAPPTPIAPQASNGHTLWWPLLPAALVSLLVTTADYKLANTARLASSDFQKRFQTEPGTVWFEGHWGFQYYMEQWRAKPVDQNERGILSGDLLIIPVNNTNISETLPVITGRGEQVNFPQFLLATMSSETGAGFYSSRWGPLPWVFARIPPEPYLVFRVK